MSTDGSPPNLTVIHAEPRADDIVERLEEVLEKARAGELSSVAIAYVSRAGAVSHSWSRLPSVPLMLGAVSRLTHALNMRQDQINSGDA